MPRRLRDVGHRRRGGARQRVPRRHDRQRPPRRGRSSSPARAAGPAGGVGRLGSAGDRRRHLRRDRPWSRRPLCDAAIAVARRAVPPGDLVHAARVGRSEPGRAVHDPRRRRVLVGAGLRAARGPSAVRGPAQLLPRRLHGGPRPRRHRARRGGAPAHGAPRRSGPGEPRQRRDRPGLRGPGQPGAHELRCRRRGRRTLRPVRGGVRRVGGVRHDRGRQRGHRRPGHVQLPDPELPRLPPRHQRPPARRGGV